MNITPTTTTQQILAIESVCLTSLLIFTNKVNQNKRSESRLITFSFGYTNIDSFFAENLRNGSENSKNIFVLMSLFMQAGPNIYPGSPYSLLWGLIKRHARPDICPASIRIGSVGTNTIVVCLKSQALEKTKVILMTLLKSF
ncbi:hypothetical protein PPL_11340 [Heterostelium album PN500]|uniref:Uncharacterized protein n=1 Tax=Heterostelium pallidum (strain ATCC 26659 / Pp 5 / PN500) TaxID=670386 RepID=D3BT48_HETP5|nr:hypothetical protein PPL_11340 [Heterostelium album PN500]EFA75265.1 hypothetical protein PPL_11340 [Heterostelium album PN500]|eukprot:XP_020427399.1 hypothetical protein PPL_11340 [Heterostelium album PN500]